VLKKILLGVLALTIIVVSSFAIWISSIKSSLPKIMEIKDYQPLLVSPVFDRNNKKIGEFFNERRTVVPYKNIPEKLVQAFLAAEDDQFFKHSGINFFAIMRAMMANMRAGKNVQGGSTITQQVAKTFFLSPEKTITRKVREALLAWQLEDNLSKEDILYLYLNQIYFGHGAYGIENACQTYFKKSVSKISLQEAAILAGLPQAPSRYSPVTNPQKAKERQRYVLNRMATVGFITPQEADAAVNEPVKVYIREDFEESAPYFMETIRQVLFQQLGEETVLDKGIKIYTSLDIDKQKAAQDSVQLGLKSLDKRQGYRGALKNITDKEEKNKFIQAKVKNLILETTPERTIQPDGNFAEIQEKKVIANQGKIPSYLSLNKSYEAVVFQVDEENGLTYVELPGTYGVIDFETMKWARKPDTNKKAENDQIKKISDAIKVGDVILVKLISENVIIPRLKKPFDFKNYILVELDQVPEVEGALISFDQETEDVIAMVGGYNFVRNKNEFNRTIQAVRQTGSAFKALVYASALDKGYNPSSALMDAPLVYEEAIKDQEGQEDTKVWKPTNHGKTFGGEITFRNALVQSLNLPSVRIIEDVGISWATDYSRRFGVFSPLNNDFTLVLGSSSLTLYEMTKAFSQFGRLGKRIFPVILHKVTDKNDTVLLNKITLDIRFQKEISELDKEFEERRAKFLEQKAAAAAPENSTADGGTANAQEASAGSDPQKVTDSNDSKSLKSKKADEFFFFDDPNQLMRPQTAYLMTHLLRGVVEDPNGTAGRARSLGREVAGKTGTTNGYVDAWFVGYTPQIATGVWVGYDKEKTIGKGEVGGRAALPLWLDYMKFAHENMPQQSFPVPPGIVFANVDSKTGSLANATTKDVIKQAFIEGTEPTTASSKGDETVDFLKQEVTE
jgi:penicillin-binding protein 1A